MLYALTLSLSSNRKLKEGDCLAPMLHGALMELISPEYADQLHISKTHPFSQSVRMNEENDEILWRIVALSEEASREILNRLEGIEKIELKYRKMTLQVVRRAADQLDDDALFETSPIEIHSQMIRLAFLTPTSFKQNGEYVLFPSVRLIFQSLMNRILETREEQPSLADSRLLAELESQARIVGYKLEMYQYSVGKVRIPSFVGEITLNFRNGGNEIRLAKSLLKYGEYAGVGIKTSLGMGMIKVR